ncbi:MAG: LysR family transcriptional regulator [Acidobacteria bacterium]|nr:LysR family transcriptional regulator [Acidobacteriota bacterium]
MDLHQLKIFYSAVRTGGFTHASREMHLSQSTISQHIKQLEHELGCQLFMRVGKRVLLTEAWQLLRDHCERILQDVKNAEMAIRELNGMQRGKVRLGTGATTLIYQLPHVLETYQARYPNIELVIVSETTDVIIRDVQAQRLDLGLVMLPVVENDLQLTPLCDEELLIALPRRHPLARKRSLTVNDLRALRFILYEKKTVMRGLIDNFFASLGVTPQLAMVMENIEAIKSLVGTGLGASVLPSHAVGNDALDKKVRLLRVERHRLHRQLALVTLKSTFVPNAVQELFNLIVQELGTKQPGRNGAKRGTVPRQ